MSTDRVFHGLLRWGYALTSDGDRRNRRRRRDHWRPSERPGAQARSDPRGRQVRDLLLSLITVFVLAPLTASGDSRYFEARDLQNVVDTLDVVDLQGRRWTAADLSGRVVLIDFWASWCAPCLAQIPEFKRLRQKHGDEFEILAISLDSLARRDLVSWLNRQGVTWPQVHDGRAFSSPAVRPFGVKALPASLLVVDGKIAAENLRGQQLEQAVDHLISTRPR
jgi:thiol-disulfide isomerase/thioredoxin